VREKLLAAQRAGITTVILPKSNEVDLSSLESDVKEGCTIAVGSDISGVIEQVLVA